MDEICDVKSLFKIVSVIVTILLIIFIVYGFWLEIFQDKMIFVSYIKKFGIVAPVIFMAFQIFQVVFPVIPGGASCFAGVFVFGSLYGFIYNYVGLIFGSVLVFNLSRIFGIKLIYKLFSEEITDKYLGYIRNNKFNKIFFWGIFLPGFPDDLLCYLAGVSNIKFNTFLFILLIGKALSLLMYSIFF